MKILITFSITEETSYFLQLFSSGFTWGQFTPDALPVAPSAPSSSQGLVWHLSISISYVHAKQRRPLCSQRF